MEAYRGALAPTYYLDMHIQLVQCEVVIPEQFLIKPYCSLDGFSSREAALFLCISHAEDGADVCMLTGGVCVLR